VLVVFDRAARSTFENVREWVRVVQATADPKIVLIANKCDLPAAVDEAEIQAAGEELAFAATFFTSALSGSGIDALFMWLFQALAPLDVPGEGAFAPIGPIEQDSKKPCEGDCQL
jgi:GTPase SAR1 family protein